MEDQKSGAEAIIKQLEGIQVNEVAASENPSAGALSATHANSADVNDESTDRASRGDGSHAKESVVDKPASAPRAYKTTICKFFEEGRCDRGDDCTYAHAQEEISAPRRKQGPGFRQHADGGHGTEYRGVRVAHPPLDPGKFRTVACKNYARCGHCPFGESCNFIHTLEPQALAKIVCRHWVQGACIRGDHCKMLHTDTDEVVAGFHEHMAACAARQESKLSMPWTAPHSRSATSSGASKRGKNGALAHVDGELLHQHMHAAYYIPGAVDPSVGVGVGGYAAPPPHMYRGAMGWSGYESVGMPMMPPHMMPRGMPGMPPHMIPQTVYAPMPIRPPMPLVGPVPHMRPPVFAHAFVPGMPIAGVPARPMMVQPHSQPPAPRPPLSDGAAALQRPPASEPAAATGADQSSQHCSDPTGAQG